MTEEHALIPMNLDATMTLGNVLAKSGFFSDTREASQAVVKVLAGAELGFGPIASMTGINIIKGKVSLSANLIAAAVKRAPRYDYRLTRLDDEGCAIDFYEGSQKVGTSTFTMEDAKQAGLTGENWKKFPRNMLFARAMSNGAKWYCPDLSGGPLYTPDELGAEIDGETGEVIDVQPVRVESPPAAPTDGNGHGKPKSGRPLQPHQVQEAIRKKAGWQNGTRVDGEPITVGQDGKSGQLGFVVGLLSRAVKNEGMTQDILDKTRHQVLTFLVGVTSTKDLTKKEASAIIDWLAGEDGDINEYARPEAGMILRYLEVEAGQMGLDL